ncbi:unnamed protein product [Vitrella brassicaformis CCMP3155]|uniref:Amino acid transporter transmembrane domain-containing protein n=1 Tax=Vitrella brassicaformis (strain CCMP3155) TaxID=1169540 RepID=A0A0G4EMH4_VITBC|nr:unnamed protein product [Vitrella brassicaformis CCMP3155]|eukprot:CEL98206.1 unnamed protein product [Vitrella brassicaformis CCMP3155]
MRTESTQTSPPFSPNPDAGMTSPLLRPNSAPGMESSPILGPSKRGSSSVAATAVLLNTILGVAVLGLPWAFNANGLVLGLVFVFASGCLSAFALHLLNCVAVKLGGEDVTFYAVSIRTFPQLRHMLDGVIALKCFGVATSYLIVIGHVLPPLIGGTHGLNERSVRALCIIGAVVLGVGPASFPKRIRSLRHTAWVALSFMLYLTLLLVLGEQIHTAHEMEGGGGSWWAHHQARGVNWWPRQGSLFSLIKTLPVFIFAFTCHQNLFTVASELRADTLEAKRGRMDVCIVSAVAISMTIYYLSAVDGYLLFGSAVDSDILNNLKDASDASWWLWATWIVPPLQEVSALQSLWTLFFRGLVVDRVREKRILRMLTASILLLSTIIAVTLTDLGVVFELVGTIGSNTICYIVPALLYIKLFQDDGLTIKRVAAMGLLGLGLLILPTCLTVILITHLFGTPH